MEIVDWTLVILELTAVIAYAGYVLRYSKYFTGQGPLRTYNLYLRSVWITYSAVALLCLNLLWAQLNLVLGFTDSSLSDILRESVLVLTLLMLVLIGWMHKELWNANRQKQVTSKRKLKS